MVVRTSDVGVVEVILVLVVTLVSNCLPCTELNSELFLVTIELTAVITVMTSVSKDQSTGLLAYIWLLHIMMMMMSCKMYESRNKTIVQEQISFVLKILLYFYL